MADRLAAARAEHDALVARVRTVVDTARQIDPHRASVPRSQVMAVVEQLERALNGAAKSPAQRAPAAAADPELAGVLERATARGIAPATIADILDRMLQLHGPGPAPERKDRSAG